MNPLSLSTMRPLTAAIATATLACILLAACDNTPATPPGPVKPKATAWAQPLSIGPISYFNAQCSTCHGNYGKEIYDYPSAKAGMTEYRGVVGFMVTERSGSSLQPLDMEAQSVYCVSIAAAADPALIESGSPLFIAVKSPVMDGGLEGEVTPGCTVTLVTGKGQVRIEASVNGHEWSIPPQQIRNAKSSAGDDWVNATVEARAKSGTAPQVLRLSEEAFKGPVLKSPPPSTAPAPNVKP